MAGDLVLLTGSTGFVGFAVLRAALQHGYNVRAAVRSEEKAKTVRSNPTLKDVSEEQLSFVVVPDFLKEGAFDDATKNVKYILHVASPIPLKHISGDDDLDAIFIQPAIQGTLGVFRSAQKAGNVKRVVVTSSAAAIIPLSIMLGEKTDDVVTPESRVEAAPSPYMNHTQVAYAASKVLALNHAEEYVAKEKPSFDVIHIHPTVVLGRNELALTSKDVDAGSCEYALGLVLGRHAESPFPIAVTHIEDVALSHIRALNPQVSGNQSFLLSNSGKEGYHWDDAKTYADKHFPEAVKKGLLPNSGTQGELTVLADISKTEQQLGIKAKSFETMMIDLIGQYVELKEKEQQ